MQNDDSTDPEYLRKISSIYYRHVTKPTQSRKKYYYSMQPGFYTSIKGMPSTQGKNIVTVTMKTGSTYTGEVNERSERHGYGVYLVINGGSYEGYWRNGFKHGKGVFKYREGDLHYEGDWQCGEPHGMGKAYNMRGELRFEGKFRNGKSEEGVHWLDYKNMWILATTNMLYFILSYFSVCAFLFLYIIRLWNEKDAFFLYYNEIERKKILFVWFCIFFLEIFFF